KADTVICVRRLTGRSESTVFSRLISRPVLNPNWRAREAEGTADLVFQEALIGEVQLHRPVSEENEGWRGDRRLCHVVDLHLLAGGNARALEIHSPEEPVHLARRDALAALGGYLFDGGNNVFRAPARRRGDEQHGRIVQKL